MDKPKPRRPWWQKKRWAAAVALVAAPCSWELVTGPAMYAAQRGWPGAMEAYGALCPVLFAAEYRVDRWTGGGGLEGRGVSNLTMRHREWWRALAIKHDAAASG